MKPKRTNNKEFPCENLSFRLSPEFIKRLKAIFYSALHQELQRQIQLTQSSVTPKELKEFCGGFRCKVIDRGGMQKFIVETDWVIDNDVLKDPNLDLKSRGKVLPLALPKEKKVMILSVPRAFKDGWVHSNIANSSFVHRALNTALKKVMKERGAELIAHAFKQHQEK